MPLTRRYLTVAGLALLLVTSAACGAPTQPATPPAAPSTAPAPIDVPLFAMPTGTATLSWNPSSVGDATATTTADNVTSAPPATGWYVNVHLRPMSQILSGNNPTLLFAPHPLWRRQGLSRVGQ